MQERAQSEPGGNSDFWTLCHPKSDRYLRSMPGMMTCPQRAASHLNSLYLVQLTNLSTLEVQTPQQPPLQVKLFVAEESVRKKEKGGRYPQSAVGCSGGPDDSRKQKMSGSSAKWYLMYLQERKSLDDEKLSLDRNRSILENLLSLRGEKPRIPRPW